MTGIGKRGCGRKLTDADVEKSNASKATSIPTEKDDADEDPHSDS